MGDRIVQAFAIAAALTIWSGNAAMSSDLAVRWRRLARVLIWVGLVAAPASPLVAQEPAPRNAVTLFGGWLTDNEWEEVFIPGEVEFRDSWLVGMLSHRKSFTKYLTSHGRN